MIQKWEQEKIKLKIGGLATRLNSISRFIFNKPQGGDKEMQTPGMYIQTFSHFSNN